MSRIEKLEIHLEIDELGSESILLKADRFHIKENNGLYLIELENAIMLRDYPLEQGSLLFVKTNVGSSIMSIYCLEKQHLIQSEKPQPICIKAEYGWIRADFCSFYLDLIKSWSDREQKYNWRDLSIFKKRVWLSACLDWNGLPQTINSSDKDLIIDCSIINSKMDVYCLIGETFLGYSGYMGWNLDALVDCLRCLKNKNEFSIHFKNFRHLKTLDIPYYKISNESFSNHLMDIFKKHMVATFD
ncbi:barstar family protein [Paenibacillus elgii]|uniref:barstar family protein n=1 Tax=Paenibacillus elgii TaxID=189691 RepID=UPI000248DC9B|nr:barstar family protein [Paenibacillus elgii]